MRIFSAEVNQQLQAVALQRNCSGVYVGLESEATGEWAWSAGGEQLLAPLWYNWEALDQHPLE